MPTVRFGATVDADGYPAINFRDPQSAQEADTLAARNAAISSALAAYATSAAVTTALADKADLVGGKLPTSQLPALAITDTFTVASQAAMLALSCEVGDVAVRSDTSATYILAAAPATVLGNWVKLATPTDLVVSVNGKQGVVVLNAADVGAAAASHSHVLSDVTGLAADLAGKAPLASPALTGTPTAPTAPPGTDSTQIATTAFVLANAPSATVVSTVPATTGLDPASTDVEKALTELAARPSGGSAPITKPKVPYGSYLSPQINSMWSTPGGAYVWWVPLSVECPQAFDAIGLIVQSAGAGVTADFALVGDAGGYPGTVLGSSTGVSLTTATDASKVGAFSAVSLPVGLVWMAVRIADPNNNCQVASAANTGQQPWGVPYTHFRDLPPYPHPGAHTSYGGAYKSATVLSSIPTTAPSGMVGLARDSPLPGLRAASW
jgi:hypothetical protein